MSDNEDENTKPKSLEETSEEVEDQITQHSESESANPFTLQSADSLAPDDSPEEDDDLVLSTERTNMIIPLPSQEEIESANDDISGHTETIIPQGYKAPEAEKSETPEPPQTPDVPEEVAFEEEAFEEELPPEPQEEEPAPNNVLSFSSNMDDDDEDDFLNDLIIEDVDDDEDYDAEPLGAIDEDEEAPVEESSEEVTEEPIEEDGPRQVDEGTPVQGLSLEERKALLLAKEAKANDEPISNDNEEDEDDDLIFADSSLSAYKLPAQELAEAMAAPEEVEEADAPVEQAQTEVTNDVDDEGNMKMRTFDDSGEANTQSILENEESQEIIDKYEKKKTGEVGEETTVYKLQQQQKQKVRISLKLKILMTICSLLAVTVGLYVAFAKDLFFSDKKAYIYESTLSSIEGMNKKLVSDLELYNYQAAFLSTLLTLDMDSFNKFIAMNKNNIAFFKLTETGEFMEKKYNVDIYKDMLAKKGKDSIEKVIRDFALKTQNGQGVRLFNKEFGVPSLAVLITNIEKRNRVDNVLLVSLDQLKDFVFSDKTFKTFLIDNNRKTYFRDMENVDKYMDRVDDNPVAKGTIEFAEMNKLISFARLPQFNATFVTVVDYEQVFGAAYFLIKKSIYFGIMLLSLAAFIGIVLATNIAKPIQKLVEFTQRIAGNDFSGRIKVKTRDELGVLASAFNYMSEEIEDLLGSKELMIEDLIRTQGKLKELNEGLEQKVQERTAKLENAYMFIDAAVNSLDQGLFVINREGQVHSFATKSCENLFGKDVIGSNFPDLIPKSGPDHDDTLYKWIDVVFAEMLPFYSSKGLGPKEVSHGKITKDDYKHIKLNYFAMRNKEEELSNIVVVATEDTAEMKTKALFDEQKDKVDMILTILSRKDAFLRFVKESKKIIKYFETYSVNNDPDYEQAKYYLHTLKGNFSLFSVTTVSKFCHEIENSIMKDETDDFNLMVVELLQRIKDFLTFASKLVGHNLLGNEEFLEVSQEQVNALGDLIKTGRFEELFNLYNEMFVYKTIEELFTSYEESTVQLAQSLGKELNPFVYETHGFKIDPTPFNGVIGTLVHLFRNIADHALENPSTREAAGKNRVGTIRVEVLPVDSVDGEEYFCLAISDDGKGIDHNIIAKVLKEKGLWDDWKQYQPEYLVSAIFEDGFSTSEQVTDLSGRGVGMSAIKDEIISLGGKIKIKTVVGEGTSFFLILPRDPKVNETALAA
jgi:two-component system chemotaxis sensor kinase CheA